MGGLPLLSFADLFIYFSRRGRKIQGRRVIVSVECFSESVNGTLRFSVYDPSTSDAYECVVMHRDTRGMVPEKEGGRIDKSKEDEIISLCGMLRLIENNESLDLILFEKSEWVQKLRTAFAILPQDFTGRVSRGNVLDCVADTRRGVTEFLKGMHEPMLEYAVEFLEGVERAVREYAWPAVSFDEFKDLMEEGKKRKRGGAEEGKEDEESKGESKEESKE